MIISVEVEQGIGLFSLTFVLCKMRIVYASTEIFLVCDGQSFFKFWRTVGIGWGQNHVPQGDTECESWPLPYLVLEGDYGFELVCFPLSHVCLGIFKVEAFA